jgi:hypothetical protein
MDTAFGVIHAQTVNNSNGTGGIDISVGDARIIANEQNDGKGVAMGIAAIKTSSGSGGDIHIKTSAETLIETRGDNLTSALNGSSFGASGILARNAGTGNNIEIDNSATITTHGASAKGIYAYNTGNGGKTEIRNAGDITTSGASAHGIYVYGASTGSVDLVNAGTVSVEANNAYGIYVTGVASGTVVNEGTVSNTAAGGTAIHVASNNVELVLAGDSASLEGEEGARVAQVVGNVVFAGNYNKLSLGANIQDIDGNLTFRSTSTFEVSARSLADYQTLVVSGTSTLAGAALVFDDTGVEEGSLHDGDVFMLIDGTSISGIFGSYSEGATYTSQGGNDYTISYLNGNVTLTAIVNAMPVPEPATYAVLAGLAMLMLAAVHRSKRGCACFFNDN